MSLISRTLGSMSQEGIGVPVDVFAQQDSCGRPWVRRGRGQTRTAWRWSARRGRDDSCRRPRARRTRGQRRTGCLQSSGVSPLSSLCSSPRLLQAGDDTSSLDLVITHCPPEWHRDTKYNLYGTFIIKMLARLSPLPAAGPGGPAPAVREWHSFTDIGHHSLLSWYQYPRHNLVGEIINKCSVKFGLKLFQSFKQIQGVPKQVMLCLKDYRSGLRIIISELLYWAILCIIDKPMSQARPRPKSKKIKRPKDVGLTTKILCLVFLTWGNSSCTTFLFDISTK
jgi:hypothetical protein